MVDRNNLDPEIKCMFDSVLATVKFARWAYEAALKEGFTTNQSMQIATHYIESLISASAKLPILHNK